MSIPAQLSAAVQTFLPTLRLGLDLGERAVGIAVVRGNEVLHAETVIDFHEATLKERRRLRRGRRTRRAKKSRIARLRSWILRQIVNGKRLPDPYILMRQKRFQCQPGEYRQKVQLAKSALPSWVEAVKQGRETSDEAFVIALTHLFQKRGYRWGGSDVQAMDDNTLADELRKIRLTPAVAEQVRREVERRKNDPNAPKGFTGKINGIEQLIEQALNRRRQPRVAEHRSIVEDEVRAVVTSFGRHHGIAEDTMTRWRAELVCLLNKPVRAARFENRALTGCTWCGAHTPKKSRPEVQELAYWAAVANVRVAAGRQPRPLTQSERAQFVEWWNADAQRRPTQPAIKRYLTSIGAQEEMARQFADLLNRRNLNGRTNLCLAHLREQAEGAFFCPQHQGVCRSAPNGQHRAVESARSRESSASRVWNPARAWHDRRVVARIERMLFMRDGTPRYGGIPSLITIEVPKPDTAHRYECPHCHEALAVNLRVRYRITKLELKPTKVRQNEAAFTCPQCRKPFEINGKRKIGTPNGLKPINVKLGLTHAVVWWAGGGKKARHVADTNGQCIYCGTNVDVGSVKLDHIFPQSMAGPGIYMNMVAACERCNNEKYNRTPWQWKGHDQAWWQAFEARLDRLFLPMRKREMLLSREASYPENPTALARVGGRAREFMRELQVMFARHAIPSERIVTGYRHDADIVMQMIEGWMTDRLRRSWMSGVDGRENFLPKDRADLRNHAQDAVLVAACPPHTWRERIFCYGPDRDMALPDLAPNWRNYESGMRDRHPLVVPLGRYRIRWRKQFLDQTFWKQPLGRKPVVYRQLAELKKSDASSIKDERIRCAFLSVCQAYNIGSEKTLTEDAQADLQNRLVSLGMVTPVRRVQCFSQKGGLPISVRPHDGPVRITQVKPTSDGVVLWLPAGVRLETARTRDLKISVIRPKPVVGWPSPDVPGQAVSELDPPVPPEAQRIATWYRYQCVRFSPHDGWYRLKEFSEKKLTVMPAIRLPKKLRNDAGGHDGEETGNDEREFGKEALLAAVRANAMATFCDPFD
ncbi:MAG: hypothetical protein D6690_06140 [Nitrospirae bacterium]|nr:MAG: hypothetical protein D6690_06140 [Nitrospirota bacterium]